MNDRTGDEERVEEIYAKLKAYATAEGLFLMSPVQALSAVLEASPRNAFETGQLVIPIRVMAERPGVSVSVSLGLSGCDPSNLGPSVAEGWRAYLRTIYEQRDLPLPLSLVTPTDGDDDMSQDRQEPRSSAGYHTRDMYPRGGSTRACSRCSSPGDFKYHAEKDCPKRPELGGRS